MKSVLMNKRTDVKTANSIGKTFALGMTALYFLYAFGPRCTVVVTASTDRQIWRQFWAEVKQMWFSRRTKLGGRMLEKYLEVRKEEKWFMVAFSTKEEASFEGWHNENILLIFDESKGIPDPIWRGGERLLRGKGGIKRWLVAGTPPMAPIGEFCQITLDPNKAALWNHLTCSAWDSDNVSNVDCEEARRSHGEDSPFYQSMVLGKIPELSSSTLISLRDVEEAAIRETPPGGDIEVGVDVARRGEDETIICIRHGFKTNFHIHQGKDRLTWCMGRLKQLLRGYQIQKQIPIKVDDTGDGGGLTDLLLAEGFMAIPINFGMKPEDPDFYYDWGTEMFAYLANIFANEPISIPDDPVLKSQLYQRTSVQYQRKAGNIVLKLLSKEELRRNPELRGMKSPDRADALALAFSPIPLPRDNDVYVGSTSLLVGMKGW